MGIKKFYKLLAEKAPASTQVVSRDSLRGKIICIDASINIYQLGILGIRNAAGKHVGHIQGLFHRIVAMLSSGIKPVFIFDGAPPKVKSHEFERRRQAASAGKVPVDTYTECIKLLELMHIPYFRAEGEAEATAAALTHVWADGVATEDADALVFGAKCVYRGLSSKSECVEITLATVLEELGLSHRQFIDLCIMMGCDYTAGTLRGVGPATALKLIKAHGTIEGVLGSKSYDVSKFDYLPARTEFICGPERALSAIIGTTAAIAPTFLPLDEDAIRALDEFLLASGLDRSRYAKNLERLKVIYNNKQ